MADTIFKLNISDPAPEKWPGFGVPLVEELPNPISLDSLHSDKMFSDVKKIAGEVIRTDYHPDANELLRRLRLLDGTKDTNQELYGKYERIIIQMKFVSFVGRKSVEMSKLVREHALEALADGQIDLKEKIAQAFVFYNEIASSEPILPKTLLQSLQRSEQLISDRGIHLRGEQYPVKPTVSNWLTDYNQFILARSPVRTVRLPGSMDRASYITQSPNVRGLKPEDHKLLERLLDLHDFLKFGDERVTRMVMESFGIGTETIQTRRAVVPPRQAQKIIPPPPLPPRQIESRIKKQEASIHNPTPPPLILTGGGREEESQNVPPQPLPPRQSSVNEALYRSTLEELARQREEYEKKNQEVRSKNQGSVIARSPDSDRDDEAISRNKGIAAAPKGPRNDVPYKPAAQNPYGPARKIAVGGENKDQFNQDLKGKPFGSLNEALIRAGASPSSGRGEVAPGEEIEEKLKNLEKKVNGNPQDNKT